MENDKIYVSRETFSGFTFGLVIQYSCSGEKNIFVPT